MKQLPLPLDSRCSYSEMDFVESESNRACLTWLRHSDIWPGQRLLVTGDAGCGKTHLLHIWSQRNGGAILSGAQSLTWPVAPTWAIAIDDADRADDRALLHMVNHAQERGVPVLLTARRRVRQWKIRLRDLKSRLLATQTTLLGPPDDTLLDCLLFRFISERQLNLSEASRRYWLARLPRDAASLREAVMRLDHATSESRGAPTKPMLARIADSMATYDGTTCDGTTHDRTTYDKRRPGARPSGGSERPRRSKTS